MCIRDSFYSKMKTSGGYNEPLLFASVNFLISGILLGLATFLFWAPSNVQLGAASLIAIPIYKLIASVIGLFILAGIMHLILVFFGVKKGYEATFRALAYATPIVLLTWIPLIGILALIYGWYLAVVGLSRAHKISQSTAFIATLIPVIILLLLAFLFVGVMLLMGMPQASGMGYMV